MRTEKPRGKQRPPGRQSSYFITKRQIKESFYLHGLCCLLLAWAFAFCPLPHLGTFTFQDSHPLPHPGCFWLSSLGSCCFHLSCFTSAPVPFHRPRLLTAPPREFRLGTSRDSLPCPGNPPALHPLPGLSGATPNLWCPRAAGSLPGPSWEPVLRAGTDTRGDWKIFPGCWIHVGAGEPRHPIPAH